MCAWEPEVNSGCCSSRAGHLRFWDRVSHLGPYAWQLAKLAGQWVTLPTKPSPQSSIPFFPPPVRFNPNSVWQRHVRQAWRPGFDPWVLCGGKRELSSLGCPLIYMCPPHTHITRLQKKQDVPKHNFLRAGFSSFFSLYFLILTFYFIQGLTRCPWLAWNSL